MKDIITLAEGSGGKEMAELIDTFKFFKGDWNNSDNDGATLDIGDGKALVFTTDSFVVDPIFFPGGNIGHLAFAGTVNDILMMGGRPLGLSLSFIIEEGFPVADLNKIVDTIKGLGEKYNVPVATGDTKVMGKGKVDKIVINTSAVGMCKKEEVLDQELSPGDKIIISGGLGEHATALLSKRFDYETDVATDSKALVEELDKVRHLIKIAKDPTRGGIAAVVNEIAEKNEVKIELVEDDIPAKKSVKSVVGLLGIDLYALACEGRFVCIVKEENEGEVLAELKKFNPLAATIGTVREFNKEESVATGVVEKKGIVIMKTMLGERTLPIPHGRIVPRIC